MRTSLTLQTRLPAHGILDPLYLLVEGVPVVDFLSHGIGSGIVVELDQLRKVVSHHLATRSM